MLLTRLASNALVPLRCLSSAGRAGGYLIEVVTGRFRGAGAEKGATVQLVGGWGSSQEMELEHNVPNFKGLQPGSRNTLRLEGIDALGTPKAVRLRLETTPSSKGWFLEEVKVKDETSGQCWYFPCRNWLGTSHCGSRSGPEKIELVEQDDEEATESAQKEKEEECHQVLKVQTGSAAVPDPRKAYHEGARAIVRMNFGYGGEDAYFSARDGKGRVAMGVADGVYSWREHCIDSGLFSRRLMELSSECFLSASPRGEEEEGGDTRQERRQGWHQDAHQESRSGHEEASAQKGRGGAKRVEAREIIERAYRRVVGEHLEGSCTACVGIIDTHRRSLDVANVGDSGLLVVTSWKASRQMSVKLRTTLQEHAFEWPFQLGHHTRSDAPEDCDESKCRLEDGDVVVMGSDGLWDNLHEREVTDEIALQISRAKMQGRRGEATAGAIARAVVKQAYEASLDKQRQTPYSTTASDMFDLVYNGGKPDDIAVVVATTKDCSNGSTE